jgi:hypothetical protein
VGVGEGEDAGGGGHIDIALPIYRENHMACTASELAVGRRRRV